MARVTIEDCLTEESNNRFNLVLMAAKRARQLESGASPLVEAEKDKPTVLALREIAEGEINTRIMDEVDARTHVGEAQISEDEARAELS